MATLYYAEHVHIPQTQIPTSYFCIGQESEYESLHESVSGEYFWRFFLKFENKLYYVNILCTGHVICQYEINQYEKQ